MTVLDKGNLKKQNSPPLFYRLFKIDVSFKKPNLLIPKLWKKKKKTQKLSLGGIYKYT